MAQSPLGPPPAPAPVRPAASTDEAGLGEQMAHCAAVLYEVQKHSTSRRLAMNEADAMALMRYTMLATAAYLGEQKGHAEVKNQQSQLHSKLQLTREPNINRLLNAEAATCIEVVDVNKDTLNRKLLQPPPKS